MTPGDRPTPTPSELELEPSPLDGPATEFLDLHQSKLPADDPRLQLPRAGGRTLRKGPAIAVATGLLSALTAAAGFALQPSASAHAAKGDPDPAASTQPPVIPEAIRAAGASSSSPATIAARDAVDAGLARPAPPQFSNAGAATYAAAAQRQSEFRAEEDQKALAGPILFDTHGGATPPASFPALPPGAAAALGAGSAASASAAAADDPNHQDRKNAFLDSQGSGDSLGSPLHHPSSPYEVQAGTIIPAVLLTAINSDLPGPVIAQVRENVYDTITGNTLLVPQGARLLAAYDSMVSWGQDRILVCWRRLLFPNGDSVDLQCAPAADLQGAAGLTDHVDEHWLRLIAGAGVSSLLAASATAAAGNQTSFAPTVPQLWATNAAQSVNQTGQKIVGRDLQVQPTITVRPGFSVNVIVHKDLALPPYHDATTFAWGALTPATSSPSSP
jgi:type IV secretory pathway VirB10-like protein